MEINTDKVKTYLGFAVKSRKIKYGVDDIIKLKIASLVLVSDALAESGLGKVKAYALKKSIACIVIDAEKFNDIIQNPNIKAAAILDDNLAVAIKKNLANN